MADRAVLAYSGGLDTSVAVKWIKEKYGLDVVTLTINIGQEKDWDAVCVKAKKTGAIKALVVDAREIFVESLVFPSLQAGALYEGTYPLATALGRPLMAKLLVDAARENGAMAVAHGCTGKGNDQVRFDVAIGLLDPTLKIIAPVREWKMTRDEEVQYAKDHGIEIGEVKENLYSIDENLWGRSIECGALEDPWVEPPADVFKLTNSVVDSPDEASCVDIGFEKGVPISLDGKEMGGVSLIEKVSALAGKHGIGRIDHVENRLVGIKSREIYEAPAAIVLHMAHRELESLTLSKEQARLKSTISQQYADMIYNGLWFSGLHMDMRAFVLSSQRHVTGNVKVKMHRGSCAVVGRKSPYSLYQKQLATYEKGDEFDSSAARGFIYVHGLGSRTQGENQLMLGRQDGGDILLEGPKGGEKK